MQLPKFIKVTNSKMKKEGEQYYSKWWDDFDSKYRKKLTDIGKRKYKAKLDKKLQNYYSDRIDTLNARMPLSHADKQLVSFVFGMHDKQTYGRMKGGMHNYYLPEDHLQLFAQQYIPNIARDIDGANLGVALRIIEKALGNRVVVYKEFIKYLAKQMQKI